MCLRLFPYRFICVTVAPDPKGAAVRVLWEPKKAPRGEEGGGTPDHPPPLGLEGKGSGHPPPLLAFP